ncbi:LysR family transcriptional regulator [Roseibium sp. SCP14]|uniref:LysR family transcriptional regulator n=1 Tax=Roseibium sp. SCP14 TaxID=3141375 RepID=UPI003337A848
MRIDWLEDLVALLDTGSVVEAAAARNISQSAFSRRIQVLENLMDVALIDRETKPNRPVVALRNHEQQVRQAVVQQRHLIKQIQIESRSGSRLVVVACQHAITTSLGPRIVKMVSSPGRAHVRLRSANLDECETLLMTGQADFSVTYRLPGEGGGGPSTLIEETHIADERLIPVYAADRMDELHKGLGVGELEIIAYPPDVFLGMSMNRHVLPQIESETSVTVVAETALTLAAMQMARAGIGVAWVPEALVSVDVSEGRLRDLSNTFDDLKMEIVGKRRLDNVQDLHVHIWKELAGIQDTHQAGVR